MPLRIATYLILFSYVLILSACADVGFSGSGGAAQNGAQNTEVEPKNPDDATGSVGQGGGQAGGGGTVTTPPTGGGGGTVTTPPTGGGGTVTTPPPGGGGSVAVMPKVRFIGPPCQRGTNCVVQFQLDKAYPQAVDFDWRTDDTLYLTTALPGQPVNAQPGVHYVPTSGHITFTPGQTLMTVYVQNINPYLYEIVIGVRMRNCMYGGRVDSCAVYFAN